MYFNAYYTCLVLLMELDYLIASLTDLNQLSYYEIIELRHKDSRGRSRRDLSTYSQESKIHFQDSNFHFSGHGRQFNLKIYRNEFLLPTSYRRIHQNKNGGYNFDNKVEHCYYHGYLANKTSSSAVVSTCLGLKGVIRDEDEEEFHIEPHPTDVKLNFNVHDNRARYILYKSKDILNIEDDGIKLCGVNDSHILDNSGVNFLHFQADSKYSSHSNSNHNGSHERYRRSSTKINLKYIEVIVVIDNLKFKSHGENITAAEHRALEVLNMVDHVYKTMDTRVPVVNVVIWNIYNMASVTPTPGETLNSFERYTKDVLREELGLSFDNAQLLTTQRWGNLVGLAGIGVMCGLMSSAINRDYHSNAAITANTVAHEMGHNLGFMHYDSKKCVCDKGPCVMSSVAPFSPCKSFTECSSRVYDNKFVDGRLPCLLDYPGNLFGDPKCGNGYLEEGEECDCGTEEDCRKLNLDKCCHHTTCKLRVNAQCATGACCENCKFKRRGILCRGKSNIDCDLEEFCTGRSAYCPKNFHLQDGSPCNDDSAYCYQGTCSTHDAQCEELWGPNAKKAPNQCYELNRGETGSIWANCGKNDRGDYVGCSKDDILCGKLQCQAKSRNKPLPMFPIIGSRRGRNIVTLNDGTTCVLGKTLTSDLQDPSLTEDGMKCANNSICIEHKCQKLSTLTYIKNCSKTCMLNGGVCNNNGNCHCPKGKACPYCELAGPGGSADSGQGCILHDNCEDCFSALTKTLFIIFFLVIPVIILIVAIRYRVKLREKFMQKKQNSRREETEKRQSRRGQWSAQEMSVTVGDDTTNVAHSTPSRRPPVPPPPIVITPAKT